MLARYRTAGQVDAALSNAVADALLAAGDRVVVGRDGSASAVENDPDSSEDEPEETDE